MDAPLNSTSVHSPGRCGVDLYPTLAISVCLCLAAAFNALHCFALYRTRSSNVHLLRIQGMLLASISISSLVACVVTLPMVAITFFTTTTNHRCRLSRKFAAIFWLAPQSCNFIGCAALTIFRYLTCRFPLTCELRVTTFKTSISIITIWTVSYISISLGSLLDDLMPSGYPVYPMNKYSGLVFVIFYFSNIILLATVNLLMWLMGHTAYQRDKLARRTVTRGQAGGEVVVQRNNLKVAFVSLVLPVKNIILFLPPVILELLFEAGYEGLQLTETRTVFGPIPALSHMLDPLICIFLVQKTKSFLQNKVRQIGDFLRERLRSTFGIATPSRLGRNVVLPAAEDPQRS